MATRNSTGAQRAVVPHETRAASLFLDERFGCKRYSGTRDQLTAAGLGQPGDFPGDPGGPIASGTVHRGELAFKYSVHSRLANPMTYWVEVWHPETREERRQRRAREADEEKESRSDEDPQRYLAEEALSRAIDSGEDIGIVRRDGTWWTTWIGTKADLVAAGVCEERHFPVGRKRSACGDAHADGQRWRTEPVRRGYFKHHVQLGQHARTEPPTTRPLPAHDFASKCERYLAAISEMGVKMISGDLPDLWGSMRYDKATVDKVEAALDHARQILQTATPSLPPGPPRPERKATVAQGDAAFQAFMRAATKPS